jgi:hypothetical protein
MTREQISNHIKVLRLRATEMVEQDYPIGKEDELRKWRTAVDNIRCDIKRLEFLSRF